jgi:hypothetical protein
MKQSAVEWFADRISHGGLVSKYKFYELLCQAKEIEKEQKISFYRKGYTSIASDESEKGWHEALAEFSKAPAEKYYKETFESNNLNKTAIEWFANRINYGRGINKKQFDELLGQAKEIDKEQKISSYVKGFTNHLSEESAETYRFVFAEHSKAEAEIYYNKTYKQQEQ